MNSKVGNFARRRPKFFIPNDHSLSLPFWLKCFSYFHLLHMTVFKCRFTSIYHAHYLTLTCLIANRRRSSSQISIPCPKVFRYIVGPAALFRALDSLRSKSGLIIETIPFSDLVSHVLNTSLHLQLVGQFLQSNIVKIRFSDL